MRKTAIAFVIVIILCVSASMGWAANTPTGKWKNTDPQTRGVTALDIQSQNGSLTVQAWGQCQPEDCDWGRVAAYPYAENVSDTSGDIKAITAEFSTNFSQTLMVIVPLNQEKIKATIYTRFTDGSGRSSYTQTYTFKKEQLVSIKTPGISKVDMIKPIKEDCVSFNPETTTVQNINTSWKIVDGSHWMFDFGSNETEARQALSIIKNYNMNQSCFVGRPQPSFSYLLKSGTAPAGAYTGEDCVPFNPQTATVQNINNSWKIVDGSHWMYDFGSNETEARQALSIIKKYGFTQSCFVGRPGPSFTYLRK